MSIQRLTDIAITGISTCIPAHVVDNQTLAPQFADGELDKIIASTGIQKRHTCTPEQTALSLGLTAAQSLLENNDIAIADIALVVFVTQTPDQPFPGNAVHIQHQLGLAKSTLAFDVNLGCSGFVNGLWVVGQLLQGMPGKHALLLTGDSTSTQYQNDNTKVNMLFGDACSATLLSHSPDAPDMVFDLGSDGAGAPYLCQPFGGAKAPNSDANMHMDGTQVFAFTLREIPKSIAQCLAASLKTIHDIDYAVLHQANQMMLQHLGDKIGLTAEQNILALSQYGNTSSASIPLALCDQLPTKLAPKQSLQTNSEGASLELSQALNVDNQVSETPDKSTHNSSHLSLLLSGFGVGWSWGSCCLSLRKDVSLNLVVLD